MSKSYIKRNTWFHYKRRAPAKAGGGVIQLPLLTDQVNEARRVAAILSVEQDRAFGQGVSADDVRRALIETARREAALATLGITSIPMNAEPRAAALPAAPAGFSPEISEVVDRLIAQKRSDGVGRAQEVQIRAVMRLFVEAVDETDVRAITQGHLARFREVLSRLPKSHGKSKHTRGRPLSEILEAAKALPPSQVGLSAATVNRSLEIVRQVLRSSRAEGITLVPGIDPARLRRKETERQRDKRDAFTLEDCRKIFRSPVWTGCKSEIRRRIPGPEIIRDGLFWIPLIAVYTGARREEVAGLMTSDIDMIDGVWVFRIRPNEIRPGLKTASSRRVIPAHRDLITLGIFSWAAGVMGDDMGVRKEKSTEQEMGEVKSRPLFPDLKRKHANAGLGEGIAFRFDKILDDALGTDRGPKSFHSFRHYVTDQLRKSGVDKEVRLDILGHSGEDLEDEVYGSTSLLKDMKAAIDILPSVIPAEISVSSSPSKCWSFRVP